MDVNERAELSKHGQLDLLDFFELHERDEPRERDKLLSNDKQGAAQNQEDGNTEVIDGEVNSNDHSINISNPEGIGREENSNDHSVHSMNIGAEADGREGGSSQKVWIFLIVNLVVELLSAAFDQLSSKHSPKYALVAMLMAFVVLLGIIAELTFKGVKERVSWRWDREIPWFYSSTTPTSYRRFGTFAEIFGLVCAILQSILSTIAYVFYSKHADNPIKGSFWSVVFAFGLLSSQFLKDQSRNVARPVHGDQST